MIIRLYENKTYQVLLVVMHGVHLQVLRSCAGLLVCQLTLPFERSQIYVDVPSLWVWLVVDPFFKAGSKPSPTNYCIVILIFVTCKNWRVLLLRKNGIFWKLSTCFQVDILFSGPVMLNICFWFIMMLQNGWMKLKWSI